MTSDAFKILFIHGAGALGGAEYMLLLIVERLAERGCRPIVVCPCPSPLQRELAARAIETHDASFPAWRKLKTLFARSKGVQVLESIIESVQPHVIHVNDIWWLPQALRASRRFPIPVVAHVRQKIEPSKVMLYELNKADFVFAVSDQIRRCMETAGVFPRRVKTLYDGCRVNRFHQNMNVHEIRQVLGLSHGDVVLGTVANLFHRKGYDVMLRAMPMIIAEAPHAHYLIIGTGDNAYEQQLRRQVERLCLEAHVHFLGFQDDVFPYLAGLDVYVQPSRMEGLGCAVQEAMAMRKPVVATDIAGLSEVVRHQHTGLLVKPDDPHALAQAVLALLSDPERCRVFGAQGCRRIETQFSRDTMMDGLVQRYQDILRSQ